MNLFDYVEYGDRNGGRKSKSAPKKSSKIDASRTEINGHLHLRFMFKNLDEKDDQDNSQRNILSDSWAR